MLYLIGLGLDKDDVSLKALEAIGKCKKIYLESYTIKFPYSVKELEKVIKKKVIKADRELVENNSQKLLDEAKKQNICLLIYGDVLAATTHFSLLLEARKHKIQAEVIHASSIFTAVSETGLHLYNFGKTASLPKWQEGFQPTSFLNIIQENLSIDAHTLLLVDIGLDIQKALDQIVEASNKSLLNSLIILCSQFGTPKQKIIKGNLDELVDKKLKIKEPYCIIIPASSLHFTEVEALGL